jgi:hypothetical protein
VLSEPSPDLPADLLRQIRMIKEVNQHSEEANGVPEGPAHSVHKVHELIHSGHREGTGVNRNEIESEKKWGSWYTPGEEVRNVPGS